MLAAAAMVCRQCGNLRSECSDPDVDWHPQESVCWATATRDWGIRVLADRHKDEKPGIDAIHPLDGVTVWTSRDDLAAVRGEPDPFDPSGSTGSGSQEEVAGESA